MAPGTTITLKVYCEMLHKLRKSIRNKWAGMLTKDVLLLHDNARPHTAARTNTLIKLFNWKIFDNHPYSTDLAPTIKLEVYCEMLHRIRKSTKNKLAKMLTKDIVLLHENVRPHTAACTNALIKLFNWDIFDHPPYTPDLAPSD
jgi:hypothetical protein